jgi:hypothetical protein
MRKSRKPNKSAASSKISWNRLDEVTDTENDDDDEDKNDKEKKRKRLKELQNSRARSANSIPEKLRSYAFVKYPQIDMEYCLPNSPEKYLLPVRFPALYEKILRSIYRIKNNHYEVKMNRYNIRSGVMCSTKN